MQMGPRLVPLTAEARDYASFPGLVIHLDQA